MQRILWIQCNGPAWSPVARPIWERWESGQPTRVDNPANTVGSSPLAAPVLKEDVGGTPGVDSQVTCEEALRVAQGTELGAICSDRDHGVGPCT